MKSPILEMQPADLAGDRSWHGASVGIALGLLGLAVVALHHRQLVHPAIWQDDFQILSGSYTWAATQHSFGQAHNEHVMPLGRLTTWLLVALAGRPSLIPHLAAWQGVVAVLLGILLVFFFGRRELGHPLYGLLAAALFGVSTQYREAVWWFSASFALLSLDTLLAALLAAQRFEHTGKRRWLLGSALACGLAPCWFASGILAGPLCCLYLLYPSRAPEGRALASARRVAQSLIPLLGTLTFVALGLLPNLDHIQHLEHWSEKKTAIEAFQPGAGLVYTVRSLVDNLALGTVGISGVHCPPSVVTLGVLLLATAALIWWRIAPCQRLLVLGLALILVSYWLIYSARAAWGYDRVSEWGRYQLLSHLGLVLFIAGGLPRWHGWGLIGASPGPDRAGRTGWHALVAAGLFALVLLSQWPRAVFLWETPRQRDDLRRIEEMDRLCRDQGIAAATAQRLLKPLPVEHAPHDFNGWMWLRGADAPAAVDEAEARRRLPADSLRPDAPD